MARSSKSRKRKRRYCDFLKIDENEFPNNWTIHHIRGRLVSDPENVFNLYAMPKTKHEFWTHNKNRKVMKGANFDFQTGFYRQPNESWEIRNCEDLWFFNTPRDIRNDFKKMVRYWIERKAYIKQQNFKRLENKYIEDEIKNMVKLTEHISLRSRKPSKIPSEYEERRIIVVLEINIKDIHIDEAIKKIEELAKL